MRSPSGDQARSERPAIVHDVARLAPGQPASPRAVGRHHEDVREVLGPVDVGDLLATRARTTAATRCRPRRTGGWSRRARARGSHRGRRGCGRAACRSPAGRWTARCRGWPDWGCSRQGDRFALVRHSRCHRRAPDGSEQVSPASRAMNRRRGHGPGCNMRD